MFLKIFLGSGNIYLVGIASLHDGNKYENLWKFSKKKTTNYARISANEFSQIY